MKDIFKKILFVLVLFLATFNILASTYSVYDDAVKNTDSYISKFSRRKLFIDTTDKYLFDGTLSSKNGFNEGGFINTFEFNSTISNSDSYLITGARYFTMTENDNLIDMVDVRKIKKTSKNDKLESKITEYVIPETKVKGDESRRNPWVFVIPEYKITINLQNAKIASKNTFTETIVGYSKSYSIVPNKFFHFKNEVGDLSCTGKANVSVTDNKISFTNVTSDVTCDVRFRGDILTAKINVNNGRAENSTLSAEAGTALSTKVTAVDGYAFSKASCTNGQSIIYSSSSKTITIKEITNNTECTIDFVGVPTVEPTGDGTYVVPATGYYLMEATGAQGAGNGGKGGFVSAEIYLIKGQNIIYSQGTTSNGAASSDSGSETGGGSSTFKLNNNYLLIGVGGGDGSAGTDGGAGDGKGGVNLEDSSKNGIDGINGCGGSSAQNIEECTSYGTCGGACLKYETVSERYCSKYETIQECANGETECGDKFCDNYPSGSTAWSNCMKSCGDTLTVTTCKDTGRKCVEYDYRDSEVCTERSETFTCCTNYKKVSGTSGNGGKNNILAIVNGKTVTVRTNKTGTNYSNGKLKISFIKEE